MIDFQHLYGIDLDLKSGVLRDRDSRWLKERILGLRLLDSLLAAYVAREHPDRR